MNAGPTPTAPTSGDAATGDTARAALERRISRLPPEKRDVLMRQLRRRGDTGTQAAGDALPRLQPRPGERHEPYPLSEIQKVYWIGRSGLYDLGGGGTNAYLELELSDFPPHRVPRLAHAFRRLVARHDGLRTRFVGDGRQRVVADPGPWTLPVVNLRRLGPERSEAVLARRRRRLRYAVEPLDRPPLFDFQLVLLPGDRLQLMMRVETALVDGGSRDVFFGDLFRFYAEPAGDHPPPPITYRDYVVTWDDFRAGSLYRRSRDWWLERLDRLPPPPAVPLARPLHPATVARQVNRQGEALDAAAWKALRAAAADRGLTPSAVLAAAFAATLAAAGSGDAFTLSMVGTERPPVHPRMDEVLGNFNRLTLLPVDATGGSFAEAAGRLQEELRASLDHAHFTGSEVLRELGRRHPGRRPPSPVAFNSLVEMHAADAPRKGHKDADPAPPPPPDFRLRLVDAGIYVPQILMLFTVDEFDGALHHRSQAAEDLLADGWAEGVWRSYGELLRRLAAGDAAWERPFARTADARLAARAAAGADHLLRDRPPRRPADADAGRPPAGDLEGWLAEQWREVLGRPPAGVDEDFFAAGGDSFALARLASRLRRRPAADAGGELELWRFFERPTLAGLAALLGGDAAAPGGRP